MQFFECFVVVDVLSLCDNSLLNTQSLLDFTVLCTFCLGFFCCLFLVAGSICIIMFLIALPDDDE